MLPLQDLCISLAKADSEQEVIDILDKDGYWNDDDSWHYFGEDENNFSIIGNQQSKPESAIVEKIINSVDAMLMNRCLRDGIKPDSSEAPQTVREALIRYFSIGDGKLTNISERERSKLAENICFIATGSKTSPTYALVDMGEGQSPSKLRDTILSLRKSNKLRIPFVQGKFNMGGTGVFRFCGKSNIQLIVSKRDPLIAAGDRDPMSQFWAFTVIRREDPKPGVRSSNYKYLAPSSQILFFAADSIPVMPSEYPNAYGKPLSYGTFLKFFEYKIGSGLRTNILFDLYNKLSLLMPNIALPVKMYERRIGYSGHSFESTLSGLSVRVDEDRSNNIEENFPASGYINPNGQKMNYSIYVFKKDKDDKYKKDEGIVFTVNGQTHGVISKSFFNRQTVGLGYLADSILIVLDCTEIEGRAREDLFMNSRDRLSNHPLRKEIEDELETMLKDHAGLRLLKEIRRREEVKSRLQNSQPLVNVLQNILKSSPTLSRLFLQGLQLNFTSPAITVKADDEYKGQQFPSFFKLTKKYGADHPKQVHLDGKFRVEYKTDVENDYFGRTKDQGSSKFFINGLRSESETFNLWNGYATLTMKLEGFKMGEKLLIRSEINDVSRVEPLVEEFHVEVVAPLSKTSGQGSNQRRAVPSEEPDGNVKSSGLSLPNIVELSADGRTGHQWDEQGFTQHSALKVKGSDEDGYDFFINVDNIHLHNELKSAKERDVETLTAKYKFALVLIGIALLNGRYPKKSDEDEMDLFSFIEETSMALSPVILPMIQSLGSFEINNVEAISEDLS